MRTLKEKPERQYNPLHDLEKLRSFLFQNLNPDMSVQETLEPYTPKLYGEKHTYPQDWALYARGAGRDKLMVFKLVSDAIDYLELDLNYAGVGRPPIFLADVLKAICVRAYSQYSSWRAESELKIAKTLGIIQQVPQKSTLNRYMKNKKVTKLLHKIYQLMAEPILPLELYAAADATGISLARGNQAWRKIRHTPQEESHRREYAKLHIICGTKTQTILSAIITPGNTNDSPLLPPLLQNLPKGCKLKQVSADAGYLSHSNAKAIYEIGAAPFIMPKKNTSVTDKGPLTPWNAMVRLWKKHPTFFAQHYHRRSIVESTFSALKRKYGSFTRCKNMTSVENEILAKIICFNASVLAEALLSYDLKGEFIAN